jgi:hypothetical protein
MPFLANLPPRQLFGFEQIVSDARRPLNVVGYRLGSDQQVGKVIIVLGTHRSQTPSLIET